MYTFVFIVFGVGFVFLFLGLLFHLTTKKYLNPYKLIMFIAKKGGGKTTTLTKESIKHLKRGWNVYTTFPVPGCYLIDYTDVGPYEFLPESLIVVDEAGMVWDNRDFKSFSKEVRNWFKLQRHRHCKVILASQDFDIDLKLRKLCDELFVLENRMRVFSYGRRVIRKIGIVEADGSSGSESRIVDQLAWDSLFFFWCGSRKLSFIPNWVKYFDSFDAPPLLQKEFQCMPDLLDEYERDSLSLRQYGCRIKEYGGSLLSAVLAVVKRERD